MKTELTRLELIVLRHLFKSAEGNGHDFGFIEDARGSVDTNALGAIVSNLVKKELIEVHDPVTTDSGTFTQFTWLAEPDDIFETMAQ